MTLSCSYNKTISYRRERVLVLLTKGLKGYQIATELGVDPATISRDIQYLSRESSNNLNSMVKESLPFMYQTSIEGIKTVLNECWNIYNNKDADNEVTWMNKLNALKLAKECNESLFKLIAEGPSLIYLKELEERLERVENN
ncbi:HTH domain-containing protein [Candidatus Nitrosocosmicus agrestis]|jgi:predicted transcriptional regulator|uniref:HTH domain-containing protein n=1 Tax=Candidatus Nitrosocosmicus agrestis TaxID=2563600 RepID=UPI00122DE22A|nr:helix-turn-helix domain-containing protein [Candidatus Nitrosocosmicus sp. SS]KAA2283744.1 helix-turn-helix domain-containing protein [Candidatus Nitrosocosmicus sp. SS]KAF0870120.1 helix-turn-helix domain-containing protein [Candidatus Nitrosocosmicus sp. SS]